MTGTAVRSNHQGVEGSTRPCTKHCEASVIRRRSVSRFSHKTPQKKILKLARSETESSIVFVNNPLLSCVKSRKFHPCHPKALPLFGHQCWAKFGRKPFHASCRMRNCIEAVVLVRSPWRRPLTEPKRERAFHEPHVTSLCALRSRCMPAFDPIST